MLAERTAASSNDTVYLSLCIYKYTYIYVYVSLCIEAKTYLYVYLSLCIEVTTVYLSLCIVTTVYLSLCIDKYTVVTM